MKKLFLLVSFLLLFTLQYCGAQSWLWGRQGTNSSDTWGIALDNKGNPYLAGSFFDSISFGNSHLISPATDSYVVKYDSLGNIVWVAQSKSASKYSSTSIVFVTADNYGDEYITGYFDDTVSFGANTISTQSNNINAFLAKYDLNGNVIWTENPIQSLVGRSVGESVTTDIAGNVYICGYFRDTIKFGAFVLTSPLSVYGGGNVFLVKYAPNGTILWAKESTVPSSFCSGTANSVITDKTGSLYITGSFADTISFGSYTLRTPSNYGDLFLVKYDANGNVLWAKQANVFSSTSFGVGNSVVTDMAGNSYITGYITDTTIFGPYTLVPTSGNYYGDFFLVKYDVNGNVMWAKQSVHITANSDDWSGYSVTVDNLNNIYLSAGSQWPDTLWNTTISFGKDTFPCSNVADVSLLLKLDTAGNVLCSSIIRTGGDDNNTVICDPSGKYVYLGGDAFDTVTFNKDHINGYGNEVPFIARWQPCSNVIDTIPSSKEPCPGLFVPDAFSPNNDGQNDVLYLYGPCVKTMDFVIFDRWGNKVFESENESDGWDGKFHDKPMNTGTYVYFLKATLNDGSAINKKGNITLVR